MTIDFYPFSLTAQTRAYVWGGTRLRPGPGPTAEVWAVHENNPITSGELSGMTLGEACARFPTELLGAQVVDRFGARFPILVKLLDCAEWLSLQVHPNDEQAAALEKPGLLGKTEAWHILEAAPGATLLAGVKEGVSAAQLESAVRDGKAIELANSLAVAAGDTVFMPAGTLHALGPGLLVYEVQESSDLTYRVYDWGRPASAERPLHIEKSIAVLRADSRPAPRPLEQPGPRHLLVECAYFRLERLAPPPDGLAIDPAGQSFHALTCVEGSAALHVHGRVIPLPRFETVFIPAASPVCRLKSAAGHPAVVLKSSLA